MPKREFTYRFRVRNWPEYSQALESRGRLTLWFDDIATRPNASDPQSPSKRVILCPE